MIIPPTNSSNVSYIYPEHHNKDVLKVSRDKLKLRGTAELEDFSPYEPNINRGKQILQLPYRHSIPEPKELVKELTLWGDWLHAYSDSCPQTKKLHLYFHWLSQLPSPADPYWDQIPDDHLAACLSSLSVNLWETQVIQYEWAHRLTPEKNTPGVSEHLMNEFYFIMMVKSALAYRLVSRIYPEQFKGWGIKWDPTFIQKVNKGEVFFNHAHLQKKLLEITDYIKELESDKKGFIHGFCSGYSIDETSYSTQEKEKINANFKKSDKTYGQHICSREKLEYNWHEVKDEEIQGYTPFEQHLKFLSNFFPEKPCNFESFYSIEDERFRPYHCFEKILRVLLFHHATTNTFDDNLGSYLNPSHYKNRKGGMIRALGRGSEEGKFYLYSFYDIDSVNLRQSIVKNSSQARKHPESISDLLDSHLLDNIDENSALISWHKSNPEYSLEETQKNLYEIYNLAAPYNERNRIALILHWMKKNADYLRHPYIQRYIFQLLLSGLHVEDTYRRSPYVLDNLRSFLQKMLTDFKPASTHDQPHIAFWARLGYLIETRISAPDTERHISFYRDKIETVLREATLDPSYEAELKLLMIYMHGHQKEISADSAQQFVHYLLEVNNLYRTLKSFGKKDEKNKQAIEKLKLLRLEVGGLMFQWRGNLETCFSKINLSSWVKERKIEGLSSKRMFGKFPIYYVEGGGTLDLTFGHYTGGRKKVQGEVWSKQFPPSLLKHALGINSDTIVEFDKENWSLESPDGSYHCYDTWILPKQPLHHLDQSLFSANELDKFWEQFRKRGESSHRTLIYKSFSQKGLAGTHYSCVNAGTYDLSVLPPDLWHSYIHWVSTDDKKNRHLIICDPEKRLPYAKLTPIQGEEKSFTCVRLDEEGFETETYLTSFKQLEPVAQNYLKKYIGPSYLERALIWVDSQGVIESLFFPSLNLNFVPKGTKNGLLLESKEFPGNFLLSHAEKKDHLPPDAFLIGKLHRNTQFVIIPHPTHSKDTPPHSTLIWNTRNHNFQSKTPEEKLLFVLFLLKHQYYSQALTVLDSLEPLHSYDTEAYTILNMAFPNFTQNPDLFLATKEDQRVWLQILLHLLDNRQQFFAQNQALNHDEVWTEEQLIALIRKVIQKLPKSKPVCALTPHQHALLKTYEIKADFLPTAPLLGKEAPTNIDSKMPPWYTFPLEEIAKRSYELEEIPPLKTPFVLSPDKIGDEQLIAQKMYKQLHTAHEKNGTRAIKRYTRRAEVKDIKAQLKEQIGEDREALAALTQQIEVKANQKLAQQKIFLHDQIIDSLMNTSYEKLQTINPHLSQQSIHEIWQETIQLMLLGTRIDQAKAALKEESEKEIAKILYKQRTYDPNQYPQLLIFEYSKKIFLRDEQVKLIKWVASNESDYNQLLVEFQAGGGKTKIISPLLCYFAIKKGWLPIFFSLPANYPVVKQDVQECLQSVFRIKTHVLEIDLSSELSDQDLAEILSLLRKWQEEGAAVVMTPVVYHKLHLSLYSSLNQPNPNHSSNAVLNFLKEKGLFIIDEAHRNLMSTWQAIIALDEKPCFNPKEQALIIAIYKLLMGITPIQKKKGTIYLSESVRLREDGQVMLNTEQRETVLNMIAAHLCKGHFKIKKENRGEAKDFLCNPTATLDGSPLLKEWSKEQREEFYLARGLLTQILPISLKMMHEFDYGAPTLGHAAEMPRMFKEPTGAQFADPTLAAALSCQGTYPRGLALHQFSEMMHAISLQHNKLKERSKLKMARLLSTWQQAAQMTSPLTIEDMQKDPSSLEYLYERLKMEPLVIEYYLSHHLLGKVQRYTQQMNSTAADLNAGCHHSVLFSATLGMPEEYPVVQMREDDSVQRTHMDDLAFQAAAIERACMPMNARTLWLKASQKPEDFFEQIYNQDPKIFENLEGVIDIGGWHRHATTEEIALDFLKISKKYHLPFQGAVFIREKEGKEASCQVVLQQENGYKYIDVVGSDYLAALKTEGFKNPEKIPLFKVFASSQATGTDLYLSPKAKMLLTVGFKSSLWDQIQAMMRCRGFLEPIIEGEISQSIVWVSNNELKDEVATFANTKDVSPREIIQWCFYQEAHRTESRIILQACQSILQTVRGVLESRVNTDLDWVQKHKKGLFFEEIAYDLALQYAASPKKVSIESHLKNYYRQLLAIASLDKSDIPKKKIRAIIAETKALIKSTTTQATAQDAHSTIQTHQQQQQQFQRIQNTSTQQQSQTHTHNLKPAPHLDYATTTLTCDAEALQPKDNHTTIFSANTLLFNGNRYLYEDLFLLGNVCQTNSQREISLKPIHYFLLVLPKDGSQPQIYCVSDEDAEAYAQQLYEGKTDPSRYIALCTASGEPVQNATKDGIPDALWDKVTQSDLWSTILNQIGVINGSTGSTYLQKELIPYKEAQGLSKEEIISIFGRLTEARHFQDPTDTEVLTELFEGDEVVSIEEPKMQSTISVASPQSQPFPFPDLSQKPLSNEQKNNPSPGQQDPSLSVIVPHIIPSPGQQELHVPQTFQVNSHAPSRQQLYGDVLTQQCGLVIKTQHVVFTTLAAIAVILGALASLSLMGTCWAHAPQFMVNLSHALPPWLVYAFTTASGVLVCGLISYAVYKAKKN